MEREHPESLTIAEVAAETRHKPSAVQRWIHTGIAVNGRRVKLAALRIGGRYQITRAALEQFIRDCNPESPPTPESPAAFQRRAKAAQERVARRLNSRLGGSLPRRR